jgi:hypothetical protein
MEEIMKKRGKILALTVFSGYMKAKTQEKPTKYR